MTDDEQITALFDRMCDAWTAGDAQAYGRVPAAQHDVPSRDRPA